MQRSTDAIPYMDFNKNPGLLSLIAQYRLDECETTRETDHVILPSGKGIADIKAHLQSDILKMPSTFPMSFFIKRLSAILINETSQAIIEPDAIEQLLNYLKQEESFDSITDIKLSGDEKEFCQRHGVLQYIPEALKIIKCSFSNINTIYTELLQDPDSNEQWLVINVEVKGEIEDILDMYDKYTGEWVSRVPWPQRGKIRLSYIII
jgi:hypothetical protein